jgi:hypothetical protein
MTHRPLIEPERMYLRRGRVAHLVAPWTSGCILALCRTTPRWPETDDAWRGTGSQDEYERAQELPTCLHCERIVMTS